MFEWDHDLKLAQTDLYMDSRQARPLCFVSHAHSDHLASHGQAIATPATALLARRRVEIGSMRAVEYGESFPLDDRTTIRLLSAGHVLGSAMLHATRDEGTLLYTGDFKLRQSLTAGPAAAPLPADVLVMECTYGKPIFHFPPWRSVAERLFDLVEAAFREGRQPIVMGYSLGKAQEITRLLTSAGFPVTLHGAPWALHQAYGELRIPLGNVRRYVLNDFHGPRALDLRERGVLVAPPNVARAPFVTRFKNPCTIVMTGWALLPDAIYRYGVNHALPLSDHADFDELLELIDRVSPKRIFTHHGYTEFARTLRDRGHDATPARPDAQLSLFGE